MEEYIKQNVLTKENISLIYLSPYTDIAKTDSGIFLKRSDSKSMIILETDSDNIELCNNLLEELKTGISEQELRSILSKIVHDECDNWIENCIWEGIIE